MNSPGSSDSESDSEFDTIPFTHILKKLRKEIDETIDALNDVVELAEKEYSNRNLYTETRELTRKGQKVFGNLKKSSMKDILHLHFLPTWKSENRLTSSGRYVFLTRKEANILTIVEGKTDIYDIFEAVSNLFE